MESKELPHPEPDFFKSNHRPYYIVTAEWVQHSMGTRVTFQLCHLLNELGYEAYVVAQNPAPNLRTPLLTKEIMKRHKSENRPSIAVYTELMWGNTLDSDIVVRFMTNRSGMYGNDIFDTQAHYFYWSAGYSKTPNPNLLIFPSVDPEVFNNNGVDDTKRRGFAYYSHKHINEGKGKIADKIKDNGISLCKNIPRTHEEIAKILRSVKVLYVYEDTALAVEAAMCGCQVVHVNSDFFKGMEESFADRAIVIPESEIDINVDYSSYGNSIEWIENLYKDSFSNISNFITITQHAQLGYTGKDALSEYCKKYKRIFIYGSGIFGSMVYNSLTVSGVTVECFVVSDNHYDDHDKTYLGVSVKPLSWYKMQHDSECGIVLAMVKSNAEQIIPGLDAMRISYFN